MAAKILIGEADISEMPIEYTDVTKKYNKTICEDLGLTVPEATRPSRGDPHSGRQSRGSAAAENRIKYSGGERKMRFSAVPV